MAFHALSNKSEIRSAFKSFRAELTRGIKPLQRSVGWQGGGGVFSTYWLPAHEYWCVLEGALTHNRYWCAFGVDDPHEGDNLTITCEINSPYEGVNRRIAGAFIRDSRNWLAIAHSGRIGGGRTGIGRAAFLSQCRCAETPVTFADGKTFPMLIVCALADSRLRAEVGKFVREVERVKKLLVTPHD